MSDFPAIFHSCKTRCDLACSNKALETASIEASMEHLARTDKPSVPPRSSNPLHSWSDARAPQQAGLRARKKGDRVMLYRHIQDPKSWNAWTARVEVLVLRLSQRIQTWWENKETIKRLSDLDDHLLADLGMERDEIAARVAGRRR
jgi:uncharacterized protein YjiS (DUF1127 family)